MWLLGYWKQVVSPIASRPGPSNRVGGQMQRAAGEIPGGGNLLGGVAWKGHFAGGVPRRGHCTGVDLCKRELFWWRGDQERGVETSGEGGTLLVGTYEG